MKFIENLFRTIEQELLEFVREYQIENFKIALIGSFGVAAYGVEVSTRDIDFLCYGEPYENFTSSLFEFWEKKEVLVRKFNFCRDPLDPLKHSFCRIKLRGEIVDFLVASYKWEVTGLAKSPFFPGFSLLRVFSKPYLIALKLKAGGLKDLFQVQALLKDLSSEELQEVQHVAREARVSRILQKVRKGLNKNLVKK
ncbi:MAG: hypothetical protein ABWJ99_06670 [Caldimicrobium sp.]